MSHTNTNNTKFDVETLSQFQRADEIIHEAKLAYNAEQQQRAMILSQVRLDAAQKFRQDNTTIINQVAEDYKTYMSRTGIHPDYVKTVGKTNLSIYRNPFVEPSGKYSARFGYHDINDIYLEESQKVCQNTGEMLKMLGYKITKANTQEYVSHEDRNNPVFIHACTFTFDNCQKTNK